MSTVDGVIPAANLDPLYEPFTITTPAGTTRAAPLLTALNTLNRYVRRVQLVIPYGHNGQTGFSIRKGNVTVLPWLSDFIVGNDETLNFELPIEGGNDLKVASFNTGTFSHQHFLRLETTTDNPIGGQPAPIVASTAQLAPSSIDQAAGDLSGGTAVSSSGDNGTAPPVDPVTQDLFGPNADSAAALAAGADAAGYNGSLGLIAADGTTAVPASIVARTAPLGPVRVPFADGPGDTLAPPLHPGQAVLANPPAVGQLDADGNQVIAMRNPYGHGYITGVHPGGNPLETDF